MRLIILLFILSFYQLSIKGQTLKVSADKRYLIDAKGKPFFWMGDTAWELFHKLSDDEADHYLETRAKQGFTVIQAVIISEDSGLTKPDVYGHLPFTRLSPLKPNDAFFKHIDHVINKAASLGLYMAVLPTWADKVPSNRAGKDSVIFDKSNALIYGEFLARRYAKKPIIWVLGGDRDINGPTAYNIWKAMAAGLKKGNSRQLITYHPAGESSSSRWFQNDEWIDFNTYQSGHAHHFMPVFKFAQADYYKKPVKPFLDAEPAYEEIPVEFWAFMKLDQQQTVPSSILNKDNTLADKLHFKNGFFTDYDVRVHAYWNLLSGACGYTYGHNAVWQMFKKGGSFVIPTLTDWKEALNSPGARQIKNLNKLFANCFYDLIPNTKLIKGKNAADSTYIAAASNSKHTSAIVYMALGQSTVLDLKQLKYPLKAYWYDPRLGKKSYINTFKHAGIERFTPPTAGPGNDWVLLLKSKL
ncbi:DUF4038 domain-containing protein [uncultured Mucilaginibacter sp.]|uniref:apiosidase-like domain-containing protein n=1 Tax=uncultured Mucilaginibacter sp. TaxID=797541 RepID=UPI0025D08853|nr:DUF4038 domain-containing protein [uncultured Mucilaginibacter sp.]